MCRCLESAGDAEQLCNAKIMTVAAKRPCAPGLLERMKRSIVKTRTLKMMVATILRCTCIGLVLCMITVVDSGPTRMLGAGIVDTTPVSTPQVGSTPVTTPAPTSTAIPTPSTVVTPTPTVVIPSPTAIPTSPPSPTPTPTTRPIPTPTQPTATPLPTATHKSGGGHKGGHGGGSKSGSHGNHGTGSGNGEQPSPPPSTSAPAPPSVQLPTVAQLQAEGELGNGTMPQAVRRWAYLIVPTAGAYGLPPDMVAAVITVESGGDPTAWNSGSDARGLMQVLHGPWDPAKNIDVGVSMLAGFKQEFGSWTLTLAAYNAGPGAVQEYGGVPPFHETQDYVVVVQYLYEKYSDQPLTSSSRAKYIRSYKHLQHLRPHLKHLKAHKKVRSSSHNHKYVPGENVLPDGCDPSSPCRPRNIPDPISDPFWPLNTSPDPLPVVKPAR